tara:strand:+ start:178730 stop:179191 length:462 start_codon:yes stop_codon:yes gene_type:complete
LNPKPPLSTLLTALVVAACHADAPRPVSSNQIIDDAIPQPVSNVDASAEIGQQVFSDRDQGHCVLCHVIPAVDAPFQGNVGPELTNIGDRLSPGQIRLRIVDVQSISPETVMPSYYRIHDLYQVDDDYAGRPILSADQVEHLVAFLSVQKDAQ